MNSTDDPCVENPIDELLLPYVPPRILDDKPIPLDANGLPLDYREIAATLNREVFCFRKVQVWAWILFCPVFLWSLLCLNSGWIFPVVFYGVTGTCFLLAGIVYVYVAYWSVRRMKLIETLKKQINFPKWWTLRACFSDPEIMAVRLLKGAGYTAKYHRIIDLEQFEN
ncbi:MAG: hypothetical protein PHQ75_04680 [Thermoguttaceae bacterium]|nr:hypothetical protein [Thermoguttaceae bacterium]